MTRARHRTRTRLISAFAFGLAASAFAALAALGLHWLFGGLVSMRWVDTLGLALTWASPCILAGAIAGPAVARQAHARAAAGLGVLTTAPAAFVQMWGAVAAGAGLLRDLTGESSRVLLDPALWLNALVLAVVMTPLGALAGWAVWRTVRRDTRATPEA